MKERIVVGMSGGVDSSVAALLLRDAGYDVVGVTLALTGSVSDAGIADARLVAEHLGIEHRVVDLQDEFQKSVMEPFTESYLQGLTPNPCVICNRIIKFGAMLQYAKSIGAEKIATGHYARTIEQSGRILLCKSDSLKDQSYFLCMLSQQQLRSAVFPLSGLDKETLRHIAEDNHLPVAQKKDSQDVCFIPDGDYVSFICRSRNLTPQTGDFVDMDGNVIGRHQGILRYTVGQRKGLGAFGKPMFVTAIDPLHNRVVLGENGKQYAAGLCAYNLNWIAFSEPPEYFDCDVRIRFRASPAPAHVHVRDGQTFVHFYEPQRSVTPGQTVAFYDGDIVLGGGTILHPIQGGSHDKETI
ncbi:MAG: tRNA 2-thiouridine(34) synthase MnmA [Clostridia bacterium]|nr:tRNA 2-thiouridine(34) synthase MnmA [Clostridia bacterium]